LLHRDEWEDIIGDDAYKFIGKVGRFCPIKDGCGGGILLNKKSDETYAKQMKSWEQRKAEGKSVGMPPAQYSAATGTDGYFWEEAEVIKLLHKEDVIDKNYFRKLCDDAIAAIEEYGNFYDFVEGHIDNGSSVV
jgi:hypothetical protein